MIDYYPAGGKIVKLGPFIVRKSYKENKTWGCVAGEDSSSHLSHPSIAIAVQLLQFVTLLCMHFSSLPIAIIIRKSDPPNRGTIVKFRVTGYFGQYFRIIILLSLGCWFLREMHCSQIVADYIVMGKNAQESAGKHQKV